MSPTERKIERGRRLAKLRANAEATQEAMAAAMGYEGRNPSANISRIESGHRGFSDERSTLAARFLASSVFLVDDWEYLLEYLNLAHADLRGCIAPHTRLALADRLRVVVDNTDEGEAAAARDKAISNRAGLGSQAGSRSQKCYSLQGAPDQDLDEAA